MNNTESAKKGFRTFILTLSISLIVFSGVYYLLTAYGETEVNGGDRSTDLAVVENPSEKAPSENVQGAKDEKKDENTVFGEIVNRKPSTRPQEVLAGATSAPQSTQSGSGVPDTGYTEMTIGLVTSFFLILGAMVYSLMNPRKLALSRFEKDAIRSSDK